MGRKRGVNCRCGHCGAAKPNLHRFVERVREEGTFITVRCLLCGWRWSEPDLSGYRVLGWSSPWPRHREEWATLNLSGEWAVG